MSKSLITVGNGYKSIFAARQRYTSGKMTKAEFNRLVMLELAKKSWKEISTLEQHWHWLSLMGAYFELKHLGIE